MSPGPNTDKGTEPGKKIREGVFTELIDAIKVYNQLNGLKPIKLTKDPVIPDVKVALKNVFQ